MNAVFTICAKNYLAQALTLRDSVLKFNDISFFIFLADDKDDLNLENLISLDSLDIDNWRSMAFKYNVIEFSTSIKPYCFIKLFSWGYQKVLYLDPDMFVVDELSYIWDRLDKKSVILTPHYLDLCENFTGAVPESVFNRDGIFNLGFAGLKNNEVGKLIASWWRSRLQNQCFSDVNEATFTDQKWMDFVPDFIPEELDICRHFGMNVAIWNLHERELIYRNGKYIIRRILTGEEYPLLFYHFSGFDPFEYNIINRRHPNFTVENYPSFKPLIEVYRKMIYDNGYEYYSKMKYAYNTYEDGTIILMINRRLYRTMLNNHKINDEENPFLSTGSFYKLMKEKHLLSKKSNALSAKSTNEDIKSGQKMANIIVYPMFKLLLRILGADRYELLLGLCRRLGHVEYNIFLIER